MRSGMNLRGPRRWPRRLAVFVIFVAVIVALLPTLVAKTPLRNVILSAVLPKNSVQVAIGDASLGWFSPPSVSGIEVRDAAGRPLVAVESVQLSRSPWRLATNWHELGEIVVTRPVVYVAVRPDGSNVEDVIHQLTATAGGPSNGEVGGESSAKVAVAVKVVDGTVLMQDAATGRGWRVASLECAVRFARPGRWADCGVGRGRDGSAGGRGRQSGCRCAAGQVCVCDRDGCERSRAGAVAGGFDHARGGRAVAAAVCEWRRGERGVVGAGDGGLVVDGGWAGCCAASGSAAEQSGDRGQLAD